jgi:glycerol-3-phosphate dehydrogenase (NAD(P)+)
MSEVIRQETSVIRSGCLAGPNLAKEILEGQPAATVIASEFDEVIEMGRSVLAGSRFIVYGSYNLKGIELAGALKNIIAIASGIMNGVGYGKNMEALLLTRGLREMIHIAKAVGAEIRPFLGTAGVGDLIATATSEQSRNYTFGQYIAKGKSISEILDLMEEVAEGYRTINFAYRIVQAANLQAPITKTLYKITYQEYPVESALHDLINNPLSIDVDFI